MSTRLWGVKAGYYWKVVFDPTRTGDDPGIFYGGCFRWSDIQPPTTEAQHIPCPWPSGTVFQNVRTGERVVIRRGRVVKERQDSRHCAEGQRRRQDGRSAGTAVPAVLHETEQIVATR